MKQLIISAAIAAVSLIATYAHADGISISFSNEHAYIGLNFGDPWYPVATRNHRRDRIVHPRACHVVTNHSHGRHFYRANYKRHGHNDHLHAGKVARYKHWKKAERREARHEARHDRKLYKSAYRGYRGGRDWARAE